MLLTYSNSPRPFNSSFLFASNYCPLENLALGKQAAQSSTHAPYGPQRAVDGNPNPDMFRGHCSHTNANNPSWWRVDLGSNYVPVSEVHIVTRLTTCCPERNRDYSITVGE